MAKIVNLDPNGVPNDTYNVYLHNSNKEEIFNAPVSFSSGVEQVVVPSLYSGNVTGYMVNEAQTAGCIHVSVIENDGSTRYFALLDGSTDSMSLSSPVTFTGNFKVVAAVYQSVASRGFVFSSGEGESSLEILAYENGDRIAVFVGGVGINYYGIAPLDLTDHNTFGLERVGDFIFPVLNGDHLDPIEVTGSFTFSTLGKRVDSTLYPLAGIYSSLLIQGEGIDTDIYELDLESGTSEQSQTTSNTITYNGLDDRAEYVFTNGEWQNLADHSNLPLTIPEISQGLPQLKIHTTGDSFVERPFWIPNVKVVFSDRNCQFSFDKLSGRPIEDMATRYNLMPVFHDDLLVIMDGGVNDVYDIVGGIESIDSMVGNLTHDKWVYIQPTLPSDWAAEEEEQWQAYMTAMIAHVGEDHYLECIPALQAANDGSTEDLEDVANGYVPRSLRVDPVHETEAAVLIRLNLLKDFINAKGW